MLTTRVGGAHSYRFASPGALALAVAHLLKRDLDPSPTIDQPLRARTLRVMALCFAAWAAASALLFVALAPHASSSLGRDRRDGGARPRA